jgi:hypothetical protein
MIEHESQHLPPWSMELPEDEVDLLWLQVNLGEFWPVVEQGCREIGRGALVATIPDAALQSETMTALYMQAAKLPLSMWQDLAKMIAEYDPAVEFVAVIQKPEYQNAYRVWASQQENSALALINVSSVDRRV